MSNIYSTLPNSSQLSLTQFRNRHVLLGESFALPNMNLTQLINWFKPTYLVMFYSTRNSLGVSWVVEQGIEVNHG